MVEDTERQGVKMGIPVTLGVGGFLVSGFVISGSDYFEEFSEIVGYGLPDQFDDETKDSITRAFRTLGEIYEPREETLERTIQRESYNFVHLRDARFVHPGGDPIPTNRGMLWRTKLEAVDGFTLGAFMVTPDEEDPEPDE